MSIGEQIKQIRIKRGLSQKELANMVGLSDVAIVRYEKGRVPKQEILIKIAKALDVNPEDLINSSILEKYDKLYPDLAKETKEFENFINFIKSTGYFLEIIQEDEENYSIELSKDENVIEFSREDFEKFQLEIQKFVDYQIWKKSQEKK